jgi:hypothetical protein
MDDEKLDNYVNVMIDHGIAYAHARLDEDAGIMLRAKRDLEAYRAAILKEAADRAVEWYRRGQIIPAHLNSLAIKELRAAIEGRE